MSYDDTGVRCMMMRGGTSRGLFFLAEDLPIDHRERDDLILRLMGTPDPRQIDGLGGATSLTSKVAVVSPSPHPDADVDYLFLQVGTTEATVSDRQNCGNMLAGVGAFAIERGLVPAEGGTTSVRVRMVNSDSLAVANVPTAAGAVEYHGDTVIAGVPGGAAPVTLTFSGTEGATTGALLPTGHVRDVIDGVEATCVDNGMPVVIALADSFGLTGVETRAQLASDPLLLQRIDAFRTKAGALMGLDETASPSLPKTVLVSEARDGGHVGTRSFIPVQPHAAIGVLAAVSTVTGMLLPDAVGHHIFRSLPPGTTQIDVEHPSGHLLVDVSLDLSAPHPRVLHSGVVRTARKLFDGTAFPRA